MARSTKQNLSLYMHPILISFGTVDADLGGSVFRVALPGPAEIYDFGINVSTAQVGGTGYLVGIQKSVSATFVSAQAQMASAAADTTVTALGNGVIINDNDDLDINVDVTGTVTTALTGSLWIRFRV